MKAEIKKKEKVTLPMFDCSAIIGVFLTIATGLLFIDLVPLQEPMMCNQNNYTNETICPEMFFAQTYLTAREKFINAGKAAGAKMNRHTVFQQDGFDYTIDTAFLKGKNSKRLLIHMSGVHGIQGYTGSAIQNKLLQDWNNSRELGPSVLFIHAVNPYGMAHFRNENENNVNLNRNYLSSEEWKEVLSRDSNIVGYEDIISSLLPSKAPHFIDRYIFIFHLLKTFILNGFYNFKQAIITGQYHHAEGIQFGGREEQRSIKILRKIISSYASIELDKSIVIDVHTGYGSEGANTIITSTEEDEARAKLIFKSNVIKGGPIAGFKLSTGFIKPTDILGKNSLTVEEEFGTVNYLTLIRAIFLENAAYRNARESYVHYVMRDWLRDVYYPQTIKYKQTVLTKGVEVFNSAWRHLSEN